MPVPRGVSTLKGVDPVKLWLPANCSEIAIVLKSYACGVNVFSAPERRILFAAVDVAFDFTLPPVTERFPVTVRRRSRLLALSMNKVPLDIVSEPEIVWFPPATPVPRSVPAASSNRPPPTVTLLARLGTYTVEPPAGL